MFKEYFDLETYLKDDADVSVVLAYACVCTLYLPVYFTVAAAAVFALRCLFHGPTRRAMIRLPGFPFVAAFGLSASAVPLIYGNTAGMAAGLVLILMLICGLGFRAVFQRWQYEHALSLVCAGSVFAFLTAAVQRLRHWSQPGYRAASVTVNPNYYAALAALAALVCLYKIACASPFRIVYGGLLLMNLCGMLIADCRGAVAALIFAMVAFFLFNRQRKPLLFSLMLAFVFLMLLAFSPELLGRFTTVAQDFLVRKNIWAAGISGFLKAPIFGKGAFSFLFENIPSDEGFYPHTHNVVIEMLIDFGAVGLLLMGAYLLRVFAGLLKTRCASRHFALACAVCAYTLGHGMFDCTPLWPSVFLLTAFLLAAPTSASPAENAGPPAPETAD